MNMIFYLLILLILLSVTKRTNKPDLPSLGIPLFCILILLLDLKSFSNEIVMIGSFLILPHFVFGKGRKVVKTNIDKGLILFSSILLTLILFLLLFKLQDSVLVIEGLGNRSFLSVTEITTITIGIIGIVLALFFELATKKEVKKWK